MKIIQFYFIALVITSILFSCGNTEKNNNEEQEDTTTIEKEQVEIEAETEELPTTFTDSRDGKTYKITKIGNQVWFAENLAYKPNNSEAHFAKHMDFGQDKGNFWAYDDKEKNAEKYGYLYDYETAQIVAPKGWHLPTKAEFETLLNHYGEKPDKALIEDENGLSILYSGWYYDESGYVRENTEVGFWSASKEDDKNAWLCIIDSEFNHVLIHSRFMRGTGAAVRLIKNSGNSEETSSENSQTGEPIYTEFQDESPKTDKGNFNDFVIQYNEIIKGDGYTSENQSIKRMFTGVILKKKNNELKMIEILEGDRNYDNKFQYFYKNNQLFYAYIELSSSDEMDKEGMSIFKTEKRKYYFSDNKCTLFLFSNSDKKKEYSENEPTGNDILKEANGYLQRTEENKWNEF